MERLWAPWRMTYILGQDEAKTGCVFCIGEDSGDDAEKLVLHRGEYAFVIMNKFPYTNGHLLVAPYRHLGEIDQLSDDEALEMHRLLVLSRSVLKERCSPEAFNVGMNIGRTAGAGITDHLHQHLVPRWSGDTNFMPVFTDVRVIPQHLEETYHLLAAGFAARSR